MHVCLLLLPLPGGVVLWDCRAASRAVAELPTTASGVQLLQAMPGGTVMLTAAADGQVGRRGCCPAWSFSFTDAFIIGCLIFVRGSRRYVQ
jgi:hypothetical protein